MVWLGAGAVVAAVMYASKSFAWFFGRDWRKPERPVRFEFCWGWNPDPLPGCSRYSSSWGFDFVWPVKLRWRPIPSSSLTGGEWLSRRWTGRDRQLAGVQIGRRIWWRQ